MKRWILAAVLIVVLSGLVVIFAFTQFDLSALQSPGQAETFLATQAKRILIYKNSRSGIPSPPDNLQASIEQGETLYGTDCGMCHGSDGHTLSDRPHLKAPIIIQHHNWVWSRLFTNRSIRVATAADLLKA